MGEGSFLDYLIGMRERENSIISILYLQYLDLGQTRIRSLEINLDVPYEQLRHNHVGHHLLPPMVTLPEKWIVNRIVNMVILLECSRKRKMLT